MCEVLEPGQHFKVKKPEISWDKIAGFKGVKERLEEFVSLPLKHPESFKKAGVKPHTGILMWGAQKSGLNSLAEAAAFAANSSYISSNSELLKDKHHIQHLYETAAQLAPCIIFIGDIDVLAPRREGIPYSDMSKVAASEATRTLFEEIDKAAPRGNIITIGATYRPDLLDPALLRNGRLDRKIYVPLPDYHDRLEILKVALRNILLKDVSVEKLAKLTEYYSSAELLSIPREAVLQAIKEKGESFDFVEMRHFERALKRITPSLTPEIVKRYEEIYREECKHRYMW